jgi:hypothetical protein
MGRSAMVRLSESYHLTVRLEDQVTAHRRVNISYSTLLQVSLKLPRCVPHRPALFSTLRPAILLLENNNLCTLFSTLFFLFLLTSLSYSCGIAPLAAFACPSTPLPLRCSFLTLPYSTPCREVTFPSSRVATHGALQILLTSNCRRLLLTSTRRRTSRPSLSLSCRSTDHRAPPTAAVPISHTSLLPS